MATRLGTPRVTVIRESEPDKPLEIQTTNQDLVLWDRTRIKHKWPSFEDAPFLWMTFIAWAGARRSGLIAIDTTYESWERDVISADASDSEDADNGAPFPEGISGAADSRDRDSDEHSAG